MALRYTLFRVQKIDVDAEVAQLVEQRTENAWVPGSSPGLGTIKSQVGTTWLFLFSYITGAGIRFDYNAFVGV
jgi:hypothetical protein